MGAYSQPTCSGTGNANTPSAPAVPAPACRKCGQPVSGAERFCPHCGCRQNPGEAWYYHPVWILVLAFLVLGPFALILVWKSRRTGTIGKTLLAVVILVYTGYCAYYIYRITALEMEFFNKYNNMMRQIR